LLVVGCPLAALGVVFSLPTAILEQLLAHRDSFAYGLVDLSVLRVFAKKLFAHEKHSYTEAIALNVLVMPLARTYLLAILNGIAA